MNKGQLKKVYDASKKALKISLISGFFYGLSCIGLNGAVTLFPGEKLSIYQAEQLIKNKHKNFYLKNKKIEFNPLSSSLLPEFIPAGTYSSEGKFHIVEDENQIYKRLLLHEIGHVILNEPSKGKVSLEMVLDEARSFSGKQVSVGEIIGYLLSPEEFFCNTYSIYEDLTD